MDTDEVKRWPAQKMVFMAWHELNQNSALALSCMHVLLDETTYGFTSPEQKKMLIQLQQELQFIRKVTELMGEWISANKD